MSPRKPAKKKKAVSKPSKDSSRGRKTLGVVLVGIDKEGVRTRLLIRLTHYARCVRF